jgi:hypothetical protein
MKSLSSLISVYKIIASVFRIFLGVFVLEFGWSPYFFIPNRITRLDPQFFSNYIFSHFNTNIQNELILIFALSLIIISIAEIIFGVILYMKSRAGAIGLFATSILWVPIEILFISKFLVIQRTLMIILDILILAGLIEIIISRKRKIS